MAQNNGYISLNAMELKKSFYSGTSGLVLPVPQKLYPAAHQGKSRLAYYATLFNSIEINSSFYKNPKPATVQKWADSVPGDFRFTFKLSKAISHAKGLLYDSKDVSSFLQLVDAVGKKKGCILVQFPASTRSDCFNQLKKLTHHLTMAVNNGWRIAIEFRHISWYREETYELLQPLDIAVVGHDIPASAPQGVEINTTCRYLRFHGENGRYRGSYSDSHLHNHANKIRQWLTGGQTVFTYFNNTMGDAFNNLQTLNKLVGLL
jgi:uncharacterized protein YecE (DUF72 family)